MAVQPDALLLSLRSDLEPYLISDLDKRSPWYTPTEVAANLLYRDVLKKYVSRRSNATKKAALDAFLDVNEKCARWESRPTSWQDDLLLGNVREILYRFFFEDGDRTILDVPLGDIPVDLGPGFSYGSDGTSFFEKYLDGPLACTDPALIPVYDRLVASNPAWLDAEIRRTLVHGNPRVVSGSTLSFVPKNDKTDRTINIEAAINMLLQLGFGKLISERLRGFFGISLSTQQFKNRRLALYGSACGKSVTIDLKQASDSMSMLMMSEQLPGRVFDTLCAVRSSFIEVNGSWQRLNMIGTMGNGFTFPLQTTLFAAVVKSAFAVSGFPCYDPSPDQDGRTGNWGVFGDDIICPQAIAGLVVRLLGLLGFTVNEDKSFLEGPFRESCGADFYKGVDVRAVHIERLDVVQDRFVALNLLGRWMAKTGIHLPRTLKLLFRSVPKNYVPVWESDDAGIHVPSSMIREENTLVSTETGWLVYLYRCWEIPVKRLAFDFTVNASGEAESPFHTPLYVSFLYGEASVMVKKQLTDWKDALFGRGKFLLSEVVEDASSKPQHVTIPVRRESGKVVKPARRPKVAVNWDHYQTLEIGSSVYARSRTLDPLGQGARKLWKQLLPCYLQ